MLDARNLHVRFDRFHALRGVDLSLPQGALLGLIGPNGAGKTTLLRTLCNLQPRDAGSVSLLGEPLTYERQYLVGFTPDTPPVYEDLTVRQFLHFVGLGYQLAASDIAERTDFWLEKVWLKEKADQKLKGLSRGMRQRVGIARTLLANPALVLLDEPAAGLDPAGRVQFRQLLIDLREQGKTLIVSSHILSDMGEYCTHIGIMSAGVLVRFGTVAEVSGRSTGNRLRYEVRISRPVAGLAQTLAGLPDVSHVETDRLHATFEYAAGDASAEALLRRLVALDLPLCAFRPLPLDLEQAYLREGIRQVD